MGEVLGPEASITEEVSRTQEVPRIEEASRTKAITRTKVSRTTSDEGQEVIQMKVSRSNAEEIFRNEEVS